MITHHSSLITLTWRVRLRWLLESGRTGLLVGVTGAAFLVLALRLLGRTDWAVALLPWGVLALGATMARAAVGWPDAWAVARAADALGLEERVASALYAARVRHPAAPLLEEEATRALARIDPADYALLPRPRRWRSVLVAALALATASLAPLPTLGDGGRQVAEARAVAAARESVRAVHAGTADPRSPEPLARGTEAELRALEERLAGARSAADASRALEESQERLAGLTRPEDYAWQRVLERLASSWGGDPELGDLARALGAQDPEAVERALAQLDARAAEMSPEERRHLQLSLQAGGNAARDVPALASALREAASRAGAASSSDGAGPDGGAGPLGDLAPLLAQGAARSSALQAAQQAVAGLGRARSATALASRAGSAAGATAAGPPTGSAAGGPPGSGAQPGGGPGSGAGSVSGSEGGAQTGQTSQTGRTGPGSGAGAGAGAGGGPSPGQPGSGNAGPTAFGGSASPSLRGTTRYDPIYAPTLMGGEVGPSVQPPGDAAGAGGEMVELPDSPLELGSVRPYDQVYGRYESAARQSLARQPLPPALQGLVQRYFSALRPSDE